MARIRGLRGTAEVVGINSNGPCGLLQEDSVEFAMVAFRFNGFLELQRALGKPRKPQVAPDLRKEPPSGLALQQHAAQGCRMEFLQQRALQGIHGPDRRRR